MIPYVVGKDEVRAALPLRYVCAAYGILLDEDDLAVCPFHDDHRPSFGVFRSDDNTHDRWRCFPCGAGGDVFDLIQLKEEVAGLPAALVRARELLSSVPDRWLLAPRPKPASPLDAVSLELLLEDARAHARERPRELTAPVGFAPEWTELLVRDWGWGLTSDGWVLIPHWDEEGVLTGVKTRSPSGAKGALGGSRFPSLYGHWRAPDGQPILLCEGETDTVFAAAWYPNFQARGLPTGAQSLSELLVSQLRGRDVVLALDGDESGRAATLRWRELLPDAEVISLPPGKDLREAQEPVLLHGFQVE